jgi:hypothetical protein
VVGHPSVGLVRSSADRRDAIRPGETGPGSAELGKHAIDSSSTANRAAAWVDGPERAIRLRPGEPVLLNQTGHLTGEDQHTAAPVARLHPTRAPCSEASRAVEEHHQPHRTRYGADQAASSTLETSVVRRGTTVDRPARQHAGAIVLFSPRFPSLAVALRRSRPRAASMRNS